MKKLLIILLIGLSFGFSANAQVGTLTWDAYGNTLDTLDNTETRYTTVAISRPAYGFNFVLKVLKISGTVAGTIAYQGSNDGTVYANISTTSATDASANYTYSVATFPPYKYYRISWTGSGTMSASVSGTYNIVR